jgi:hypothetical protein
VDLPSSESRLRSAIDGHPMTNSRPCYFCVPFVAADTSLPTAHFPLVFRSPSFRCGRTVVCREGRRIGAGDGISSAGGPTTHDGAGSDISTSGADGRSRRITCCTTDWRRMLSDRSNPASRSLAQKMVVARCARHDESDFGGAMRMSADGNIEARSDSSTHG